MPYIIFTGREENKEKKKGGGGCYRSKCSSKMGLESPGTTYSGGSMCQRWLRNQQVWGTAPKYKTQRFPQSTEPALLLLEVN